MTAYMGLDEPNFKTERQDHDVENLIYYIDLAYRFFYAEKKVEPMFGSVEMQRIQDILDCKVKEYKNNIIDRTVVVSPP